MDQIKKLFFSLSLAQRISLGVALLAIVGGVLAFSHWNTERDFKPLYTGLSQEDSSAVLSKVKEGGMEYRLSENGSAVLVPSARVAEMRLQLAAAGVPKTGRIGYELFDKTNFGTSDFAEQVNYRRALEGELERTLMGLAEVEQARVHLTLPKESVFTETRQPAKASVMLTLKQGAHLAPANVNAVTQLMASAVEGLTPEGVSVVDKLGNLLSRQKKPGADNPEADDAMLEYRAKVEREYLAKVNTTLAPYVGTDHFTAGVSAECELNSGEQSEETFDPEKSVMTTAQKTEEISGANGASGIPGTPTNLPRPTIRAGGASTSVTRRTENLAYQTSRLVRRMQLQRGSVRKLSVSVLLDNHLRFEGAGPKAKRILEPPSPETMKKVRDLVAGVVGFQADRGDAIVVESLPFESTLNTPPPPLPPSAAPNAPGAPGSMPAWLENAMKNKVLVIAGAAAAALVFLAAGVLIFLKRRRKKKTAAVEVAEQLQTGQEEAAKELPPTEEDIEKKLEAQIAEQAADRAKLEFEALSMLKLKPAATKKSEVLSKHITEETKKDPLVMAQIIRAWLEEGQK